MIRATISLVAILAAAPAFATDAGCGEATNFTSPNSVVEQCVRIAPMPGGEYSDGDLEDEAAFCAIDLYATAVALCEPP